MATQAASLLDIAKGFATLPRDKQRAFLHALEKQGIPFSRLPTPPREDVEGAHGLFAGQQQIWRASRLDPDSTAYIMPGLFTLSGALDVASLETALETIVARHAILRTCFSERDDGSVHALTRPAGPIPLPLIDVSGQPESQRTDEAERRIAAWNSIPFDLSAEPPMRACLIRLAGDHHMLLLAVHHLAADGGSIPILMMELEETYRAALEGRAPNLAPLPVQYADAMAWQTAWLDAGEGERQLDYWRAKLADAPPPSLRGPAQQADIAGDEGGELSAVLPRDLSESLRSLATERGHALFPVLAASFFLLCARLGDQPDLVLGIPADNRRGAEAERLIGCFVNSVAIRHRMDSRLSFAALIDDLAQTVAEALDHRDIGFGEIEACLRAERGGAPLFSMMFDHTPERRLAPIQLPDLVMTPLEQPVRTAKFDLALATSDLANGTILARIAYRTAAHSASEAGVILDRWIHLLRQAAAQPHAPLDRIDVRTEMEAETLAQWGRGPEYGLPMPEAVPTTLARLAREKPDAPAVIMDGGVLTRGDLDRASKRLAARLVAQGIGPEIRVGICLDRCFDMIIALLAVMRSGGAFVPLDPNDPPARRRAIAHKAKLALLIAREGIDDIPWLLPADPFGEGDIPGEEEPPAIFIHPSSLAYIIHTSGSTGEPKGVMVEHGPLAAHCRATGALYDMDESSRELHFISFTFDGAHERWMTALSFGGAIILRDDELWSPEKTLSILAGQEATHAGFPPRYLQQVASCAETQDSPPPAVHLYSFGGEAMPKAGLESVLRTLKPRHVINGYGPTETVVTPMVWKGDGRSIPDSPVVPIGRPVGDRLAHILDRDLNPVPPGVAGELWIGGGGVARGYADRPGMTADRFLPDPFGAPGARMYRTGDLARWRNDGEVEFLGRRDDQVKVRGFRIELGEVEAHLAALPGIRDAAAVVDERDGITRLIGYVAPHAGRTVDPASLTGALEAALPPHMVPARLIVLNTLPVTRTGKIDRAALPAPDWSSGTTGVAPRNAAETVLLEIWRGALGVNAIGITDNFFEIGGDSILALQIVARARAAGYKITPKQLLEGQTVEALARAALPVDAQLRKAEILPDGPLPLTPIQTWFFRQPLANRNRWNQSVLLEAVKPIAFATLRDAITVLGQTHSGFRLRFRLNANGQWFQEYAPEPGIVCDERAAETAEDIARLCDEVQEGLNLEHGPLMRARLITLPGGGQRLFLAAHHLVVDGVSWRIVLDDLRGLLTAPCQRIAPEPATTPFGRWASLQAKALPRFLDERPFWRSMLDAPAIPLDHEGHAAIRGDAETVSLRLDAPTTQALLTRAPAAYRTRIDTLLLAALNRTVARHWNLEAVSVHMEGHGREEGLFPDTDLSRSTGWFTSVYPVRFTASSADWGGAIRHVKETLAAIPLGGLGFGMLRHLAPPDVQETLDSGGLPSLSFNYLGQFDNVVDGNWRLAAEDCGSGTDAGAPLGAAITIDGQVAEGKLVLHMRYSRQQFEAATISALMRAYEAALHDLVAHCMTVTPGQATPSDFPLAEIDQRQIDTLSLAAPAILDIVPPSPLQAAMLRHSAAHPGSTAYRVQVWASITGMDPDRMRAAWANLAARHDILRSSAGWRDPDQPLLVIKKEDRSTADILDFSGQADKEAAWTALRDSEYARGFSFHDGSALSRLNLVRMGTDDWRFLWTWHHALLDGWSMSRVLGELLRLYDGEALPPAGSGPRQVALWRSRQDERIHAAYWRERLERLPQPSLLHRALGNEPRDADDLTAGAVEHVVAEPDVQALRAVAARHKVTLNTLVQAAVAQVIADRTGSETTSFGVTGSGRSADMPGIEDIIDLMVGTLPLICDVSPGQDQGAWLRGLLADNIAMRQHEHAPPPALQCWTNAATAPFDTLLVFENYPVDEALWHEVRGDLAFSDVGNRGGTSYPLTVVVVPRDTLTFRLEYRRAYFTDLGVRSILSALIERLTALARE
ncbi:non-ribosomal peptide synthase domain TIGR01720/amino acid adenylation domain-containing protein [Novosphingobium sp. CF614]|uniref:non-ribosomal peptide synthetase n=1 Tax=Novosphingobium sp. CF614 TaxID=1884364 RepID=UPI0008F24B49|nr:non-ribosomal peptide synthetase [Novosphingobium sp. CF614]SFG29345.1 non-ribosomal peptide synthase domain TIGR01720/amino acid adenylation domain-containing protein [Novosphingobium sp. CF614]